ncbi:hypothetical protein PSN45_002117 [Yamadazyma tenuis]|uniref:uncharacterized protein n=1 Tax=Candida tenuis TaxID=2315449 RepID=UPI0027A02DD6|nr:hypothetical protein PSN45_002117 [Yamadazyma tenuis]
MIVLWMALAVLVISAAMPDLASVYSNKPAVDMKQMGLPDTVSEGSLKFQNMMRTLQNVKQRVVNVVKGADYGPRLDSSNWAKGTAMTSKVSTVFELPTSEVISDIGKTSDIGTTTESTTERYPTTISTHTISTIPIPVVTITKTEMPVPQTVTEILTQHIPPSQATQTATITEISVQISTETTTSTATSSVSLIAPTNDNEKIHQYLKDLEDKIGSLYQSLESLQQMPKEEQPKHDELWNSEEETSTKPPEPVEVQMFKDSNGPELDETKNEETTNTLTDNREHGTGAKDILNMKPLPYKLSVSPQFQNHQKVASKPSKYGKPKKPNAFALKESNNQINNNGVEDLVQKLLSPKGNSNLQHKENESDLQSIYNLINRLEEMLDEPPKIISPGNQVASPISKTPSVSNKVLSVEAKSSESAATDEYEYIHKFVYEDGLEVSPSEIEQPPTGSSGPFQTFKSKSELNEKYREEQDIIITGTAVSIEPSSNSNETSSHNHTRLPFSMMREETAEGIAKNGRPYRFHRPGHVRTRHKKAHRQKNHTIFNFDLFGFRSSSSQNRVAWMVVASSILCTLL